MILCNDFQRQWQDVRTDVLAATDAVGSSGWYVLGDRVRGLETDLARYWRAAHAIGVASGLDAIELSLRILGCQPGDRVLTSPISAFATVLAILKIGAAPVFADCDRYGLIDLTACRDLLKAHSEIRYFVPVHLYGHALDAPTLRSLRDDFGLLMVEDCAQAIGALSQGMPVGAIGQLAATSFYPTKNLGAMGDGGAILTASAEYADSARMLRDYGQRARYRHEIIGYNSRLDELQAAYLSEAFLPRLVGWLERRRAIALRYCHEIRNPEIEVPGAPEGSYSCWHLFPIAVDPEKKPLLLDHFRSNGVQTGEHYPVALIEQPVLQMYTVDCGSDCRNAVRFCHSEVSLPIHPYLTDDEVSVVIDVANSWSA